MSKKKKRQRKKNRKAGHPPSTAQQPVQPGEHATTDNGNVEATASRSQPSSKNGRVRLPPMQAELQQHAPVAPASQPAAAIPHTSNALGASADAAASAVGQGPARHGPSVPQPRPPQQAPPKRPPARRGRNRIHPQPHAAAAADTISIAQGWQPLDGMQGCIVSLGTWNAECLALNKSRPESCDRQLMKLQHMADGIVSQRLDIVSLQVRCVAVTCMFNCTGSTCMCNCSTPAAP